MGDLWLRMHGGTELFAYCMSHILATAQTVARLQWSGKSEMNVSYTDVNLVRLLVSGRPPRFPGSGWHRAVARLWWPGCRRIFESDSNDESFEELIAFTVAEGPQSCREICTIVSTFVQCIEALKKRGHLATVRNMWPQL